MKTFKDLELTAPVQQALADENYETPTPIQAQTVPSALLGHDVLGCAQTGTGKTAAFALPILDRLGRQNRKSIANHPHVLVLAPTRELAIQIGESFATYGRHLKLRHALVYGGVGQRQQVRALKRGAHILVATPGRLLDLMGQGHIHLDQLEMFVLDEADRMLDMGFLPDLKRIVQKLPDERQSLFFSATLPAKIVQLSRELLRDPVSVNVTPEKTSVEKIAQQIMFVEPSEKKELLRTVLTAEGVERAIVFTKTKRSANVIATRLMKEGVQATAMHGDKSQNARQRALQAFRGNRVRVLVATDVAARGIDVDGITHVVNFDLPIEPENYVHRIGRTGRAGAEGSAVSFCSRGERKTLRAIEKLIGGKVPVTGEDQSAETDRPKRSATTKPQGQSFRKRRKAKSTGSNRNGRAQAVDSSHGHQPKSPTRKPKRKFQRNKKRVK